MSLAVGAHTSFISRSVNLLVSFCLTGCHWGAASARSCYGCVDCSPDLSCTGQFSCRRPFLDRYSAVPACSTCAWTLLPQVPCLYDWWRSCLFTASTIPFLKILGNDFSVFSSYLSIHLQKLEARLLKSSVSSFCWKFNAFLPHVPISGPLLGCDPRRFSDDFSYYTAMSYYHR